MLYVAIGQLVIIIALLALLKHERDEQAKVLAHYVKCGGEERRELLNRIAQPGMIVPSSAARHERPPPKDIKAYNAIGTVQKPRPESQYGG